VLGIAPLQSGAEGTLLEVLAALGILLAGALVYAFVMARIYARQPREARIARPRAAPTPA